MPVDVCTETVIERGCDEVAAYAGDPSRAWLVQCGRHVCIAFDVNETLLDLRALDEPFGRVFGDESLRAQWFAQMLQLSFVGTIINQYVDFTTAQHAALEEICIRTAANASMTKPLKHLRMTKTPFPQDPQDPRKGRVNRRLAWPDTRSSIGYFSRRRQHFVVPVRGTSRLKLL